MGSDEVPLWQFSDFNLVELERYPKPEKPWLYPWVMNNYWFTNFRAYQEGAVNWTYVVSFTTDTTTTTATMFVWGVRNPLPARTFMSGENELTTPVFKTMNIGGDKNVVLINSRPSFK